MILTHDTDFHGKHISLKFRNKYSVLISEIREK